MIFNPNKKIGGVDLDLLQCLVPGTTVISVSTFRHAFRTCLTQMVKIQRNSVIVVTPITDDQGPIGYIRKICLLKLRKKNY